MLVVLRAAITAADFHFQLGFEALLLVEGGDDLVGVEHLDAGVELDVAGRDGTFLCDVEEEDARLAIGELEEDLLEVEHDVGHVFRDAGQGAEFMDGALELDARDGGAFQRGEEHAAQGVAEGVAVTGFKGFGDELGVVALGCGLVFGKTIGHFKPTETDWHFLILSGWVSRIPRDMPSQRTGPTANGDECICCRVPHRRPGRSQAIPHGGTAKTD